MSRCKLIIFSDIHYLDRPIGGNELNIKRKLTNYSEKMTDKLIKKINEAKPDISICLGDLIQDVENNDIDKKNFTYVWDKFKGIKVPFFSVIGNHDLRSMNSRKELEKIMNYENASFSIDLCGYHFIILSTDIRKDFGKTDGGIYKAQTVSKIDLNWLKKDLEKNKLPCIIFTHFGLAEDRQIGNYWFEKIPEKGLMSNRKEVKNIIKGNDDIIAIFSGHQHWTKQIQEDGKMYYIVGSLIENINMDGIPDGVYLEVELEDKKVTVNEKHINI